MDHMDLSEPPQSVLIVDDQYTSVEMLAGIVSTLPGAPRVKSFHDPLEALRYAQERQQDLILLDHEMPAMTGLDFLRTIRSFPAYRNVPIVMVTIQADRKLCIDALEAGATDFLNKPVDPTECKARCTNLLTARRDRQEVEWLRDAAEQRLQHNLLTHQNRNTLHMKELMLWSATVVDQFCGKATTGHIARVGHYSGLIAQALGYAQPGVMDVIAAANTHDIGTVCVPPAIMRKAGMYTAEERLAMQTHCIEGAMLLRNLPDGFGEFAAQVAEAHHENFDGSGYPHALSGEAIPRAARIVAVANVFDALTTRNAIMGRKAMSMPAVYQHMIANRGSLFDPECVDALLDQDDQLNRIVPWPRDGQQP
jgi:two-component system, response regulator RpfG